MRGVRGDIERWQAAGEQVARATVISVAGSAPRGTGATLAVSESGEISGSVSGGCVEPAVIEEGLRTMRTGQPKLLHYGITEEQNVERIGLSCGGEIRVFVQRLQDFAPLAEALRAEVPIVQVTVIASPAVPELLGASLLVRTAGKPSRTTGRADLEPASTSPA